MRGWGSRACLLAIGVALGLLGAAQLVAAGSVVDAIGALIVIAPATIFVAYAAGQFERQAQGAEGGELAPQRAQLAVARQAVIIPFPGVTQR